MNELGGWVRATPSQTSKKYIIAQSFKMSHCSSPPRVTVQKILLKPCANVRSLPRQSGVANSSGSVQVNAHGPQILPSSLNHDVVQRHAGEILLRAPPRARRVTRVRGIRLARASCPPAYQTAVRGRRAQRGKRYAVRSSALECSNQHACHEII